MKITKAVIPAAGLGTRFLPITKSLAKEMLPIVDKPCLEYIVDEARESGITEILIIINSCKQEIIDYFSKTSKNTDVFLRRNKKEELEILSNIAKGVTISFAYQNEQLGLGHAILQAKEFVGNETFAVLLGDDLFKGDTAILSQLIDQYNIKKTTILGTMIVPTSETSKYGICILDDENDTIVKLKGVVEKPKKNPPSNLAIAGRYILLPSIFEYLEKQEKGIGGEIQLTDAILKSIEKNDCYACLINGKRYDIGKKSGFVEATIAFALARADLKDEVKKIIADTKLEI